MQHLKAVKLKQKRMLYRKNCELLQAKKDEMQDILHHQVWQVKHFESRRQKTATNFDTINDNKNSTRYKRHNETKDILSYIHGGAEGAIFGAWDFLKRVFAFLQTGQIFWRLVWNVFQCYIAMKKALAIRYYTDMSRRKYTFMCKNQNSMFDPETISVMENSISICELLQYHMQLLKSL